MPKDAQTQTRNALNKVLEILAAVDTNEQAIVEMTSYHVGISAHFDVVDSVLREMLGTPLPAWTAVEVAGLRRAHAVIELRIVAHVPQAT